MSNIENRVNNLLEVILDPNCRFMLSDIIDEEEDKVIGKFYLAYSSDSHTYLVRCVDGELRVFSMDTYHDVAVLEKKEGMWSLPVNYCGVLQSRMLSVYNKMRTLF